MSPSLNTRTTGLLALAALMAGCASKPLINPSELASEPALDDGIDYYSASLEEDEALRIQNNQWTTDADGNRVYLLSQVRRGTRNDYYVGDIRYLLAQEQRNGLGSDYGYSGFNTTSSYSTQTGNPLFDQALRRARNDRYLQTRRGRVTYLPARRIPVGTNNNQDSGSSASGGNTQPSISTQPRVRRSAPPPVSKPQRRVRPSRDDSREQDR